MVETLLLGVGGYIPLDQDTTLDELIKNKKKTPPVSNDDRDGRESRYEFWA